MARYTVLMPIDTDSKRVLAQAQSVIALPAASESVRVILLHVFEDEAEPSSLREFAAGERAIEYLTEERPVASLDTESRQGEVAEEILDAAETLDVDALVLGGRKRSTMGSLVFGSITIDVLGHAERPVTITGDHLAEEREEAPLIGEQDEPLETPGVDQAEDPPGDGRDFVHER